MTDDTLPFDKTRDLTLSRRGFAALSLGAGVGAAGAALAAEREVVETDVTVTTDDGTCDAALFHPAGHGPWPGVVVFTDILGLRPAFRDMSRRLAAQGYVVLTPNPFYRTRKAPVLSGPFDFTKPEDRARLTELTAPLTPEAKTRDIGAYLRFLDLTPLASAKTGVGVVGYCMGGPYTMMAAALAPDRVRAAASFHGGGLVTDKPDSPHLLIPKIKASFYFGIASNDDQAQPAAKDQLRAGFAAAGVAAEIEVYAGCRHGWCVPDGATYDKAGAERAFGALTGLYAKALV
jgi:carboxymethylenebutenolidase